MAEKDRMKERIKLSAANSRFDKAHSGCRDLVGQTCGGQTADQGARGLTKAF
jgi:hypothetical protein